MNEKFDDQDKGQFDETIKFNRELASKIAEASKRRGADPDADYISEPIESYISIEDGVENLVVIRLFENNPIAIEYELGKIVTNISLVHLC